jgi:peptidyl-prolyl cis-trans isomerase A (cyclophilin A)
MRFRYWSALTLCVAAAISACGSRASSCIPESAAAAPVPDSFVVSLETSRGRFDVMARKAWAPLGAAQFYRLVNAGYYDDARFFRVIKSFVAQFGVAGDPKRTAACEDRRIADEPVRRPNARGTLAFARGGPETRSVQLFVNLQDNPVLDSLDGFGFPPVAEVVSGMAVVDSLYSGYGESAPRSGSQYGMEGPNQDSIRQRGNAYLAGGWPKLDYIKTARVTQRWPQ